MQGNGNANVRPRLGRGVYEADYLINGLPVLNVVRSDGNRLCELVVPPGQWDEVAEVGFAALDAVEPPAEEEAERHRPRLVVVRGGLAPQAPDADHESLRHG